MYRKHFFMVREYLRARARVGNPLYVSAGDVARFLECDTKTARRYLNMCVDMHPNAYEKAVVPYRSNVNVTLYRVRPFVIDNIEPMIKRSEA